MPDQIQTIYDLLGDAYLPIREQAGPMILQMNRLLLISRKHDDLHLVPLAEKLDRRLEKFITLRPMIVGFGSRRAYGHNQIIVTQSQLRPYTGVGNKSRYINIFLNARIFQNSFGVAFEGTGWNYFRTHKPGRKDKA